MSCLGPQYNPRPTREWTRYENRCPDIIIPSTYEYSKGNILQYKNNSSNLTKNQRYSKIATGMWTNRTKTWATQSDKYTNPNTNYLKRSSFSTITIPNNIIDNTNSINKINADCQYAFITPQDIIPLPSQPTTGNPEKNPNIPEQPIEQSKNNFILPFPEDIPEETVVYVEDGGNLLCNSVKIPCTEISYVNNISPIQSFPNTFSDVPGIPTLLFWDNTLQTYYPRVKRTYGTSGNKWPQGSKFILPVYPNNQKPKTQTCSLSSVLNIV